MKPIKDLHPIVIIDDTRKTITVSATFYQKATRYGSDAYNYFRTVKTENRNYRIIVKKRRMTHSQKNTTISAELTAEAV